MNHHVTLQKIFRNSCILILLCMFSMSGFFGCAPRASTGPVLGQQEKARKQKIVTFSVVGKGTEPESAVTRGQAFLLAERAAILDGYRLLVEKLKGVYVDALTQAGMNAIDYDVINARAQALLRGVEITNIDHKEYGIAEANMQVRVNFTLFDIVWWPEGLREDVAYTGDSFIYAPINRIKNHFRTDYP